MKPTTPSPSQLAPHVQPLVRSYIDAAIAEALAPIEARLASIDASLAAHNASISALQGDMEARVNAITSRNVASVLAKRDIRDMIDQAITGAVGEIIASLPVAAPQPPAQDPEYA